MKSLHDLEVFLLEVAMKSVRTVVMDRCSVFCRCEAVEFHHGGSGGEERLRHGAADVRHDAHQQGEQS